MGKKVQSPLAAFGFQKPLLWLLLITLLGGAFRFYNPDWDLQHSFHPDERNILGQTAGIQASTGYKVTFFAYGQLPVYLYRATGELLSTPSFIWNLCRGNEGLAQWLYWFVLALAFGTAIWFFSREKWSLYSFGASAFLWACLLLFKFFGIFSIWFDQLIDFPLKAATFLVAMVASFGFSLWIAKELEWEWSDTPFYSAAGATFAFGILPIFLPNPVARVFGLFLFTFLVAGLALWWAWTSRWGRTILGFFSLWAIFASFNHAGRQYSGYGECMIIGRVWAAAFSTATIAAVYLLVKKIYQNIGMALLASACFTFAVVSIEQAHYCIVESFITFLLVVTALCAWELFRKGDWKSYLVAGAVFGLSMAAKTSSLYYLFMILTAHLALLSRKSAKEWEKEDGRLGDNEGLYTALAGVSLAALLGAFLMVGWKLKGVMDDLFHYDPKIGFAIWLLLFAFLAYLGIVLTVWGILEFRVLRAQMPQWIKLVAAGGLAFFLFCLFSPWSLLDFNGFMISQNYEWHTVSIADACYVLQFKDTPRYLFQLENLMSVELWWPLGIAAVLGAGWVLARFVSKLLNPIRHGYLLPLPFTRGRGWAFSLPDLLLLSWFIPYFGFIGAWNTKFVRYMVPLIPVFCIFGARLFGDFVEWAKRLSWGKWLKTVLGILIVGPSFFYSLAYMHVYTHPHPWIDASVWIAKNVQPGAVIATDMWDDGLPQDLSPQQDPRLERPVSPGQYGHVDVDVYSPMGNGLSDDNDTKKNYYANTLQKADYISLATKKLWYTLVDCTPEFRPHGFNLYPVTSRYFRLLWSGLLGYKMVGEFHNFPTFLGWVHPDDMAEESFSVYDHPTVYLFKKVEDVPRDQILKLLSSDDYVKGINRDIMRTITPDNVDAFISQRHQYLEDHGLLAQLEAAAPTVTAAIPQPTPEIPFQRINPAKKSAVPAPAVEPTPEIKVEAPTTVPGPPDAKTLQVLQDYAKNPVIESDVTQSAATPEDGFFYQLRAWLSWVITLILLGWMALPLALRVLSSFPSGAYSLSKILGFFVFSWVVWFSTSLRFCRFTFGSTWVWFLLLAALSLGMYWRDREVIQALHAKWSKAWRVQEGAFVLMFFLFTLVKLYIPHIHDPVGEGYNGGGEAGMDFGFLSSIVRGETFPPQNMWMAGQPLYYPYYYGHVMMGILTKFLGLAPAVTYNLALITLFALIFASAFGLAFALSGRLVSGWIAGLLCAVAGNPAGSWQYLEAIHQCLVSGNLGPLIGHVYDFWGPSRVIPNSINEFPYFSVLYGDLHAHTLAMPFAFLLVAVWGSYYLSKASKPFDWYQDWLVFLTAGFLLGGITFLNTWDVLTWLTLGGLALLVRNLGGTPMKTLQKGLGIFLGIMILSLLLLGWVATLVPGLDYQNLGGSKFLLAGAVILGAAAGTLVLFFQKPTQGMAKHLTAAGLTLAGILVVMVATWIPLFASFVPQQSEVLWVTPNLRTSLGNFFGIYGLFVTALAVSFIVGFSKELAQGLGKNSSKKGGLDLFLDKATDFMDRLIVPDRPVLGMLFFGLVTLALVWGASWVHWTDPSDRALFSLLIATPAAVALALAVIFRNVLGLWLAALTVGFLWLSLFCVHLLHLFQDMPVTLGLGLFSMLWLAAFFHMGLALKTLKDRSLSFSYLLVALFFFILATLEVFVMKEYLGGEYLRNNSLFKFGINAWELASVAVGVFLPKLFDSFGLLLKVASKEGRPARISLILVAEVLLFVLFRILLDSFLSSLESPLVYVLNLVLVAGLVGWSLVEDWMGNGPWKVCTLGAGILAALFSILALLPPFAYGSVVGLAQRWIAGFETGLLFPALLGAALLGLLYLVWEGQRNLGRLMVFNSWRALLLMFALMACVYPYAATVRKCHGFLDFFRKQWVGYAENLTLNGLAYLDRENPYDGAAIRFMNEYIPDQPCLVEFVGEGYNSWGSRFSIFTGVPALMGWDGHVREWLTGRPGMDTDIGQRFQATDDIFRTPDPQLAKKILDAYGVRLVMVGTVERNGVPGRKGGYPPEGLAKFSSFLPLIYKNPQVEIYYNPPSDNTGNKS